MRICLIAGFLVAMLTSCSGSQKEFSSEEEALAYANDNDNGYIQTVESGDHVFSAKVDPVKKGADAVTIHVRISRVDGLSVLKHHELTPAEISEKEMYLSFDLVNDVYLRVDDKDVRPLLHHYERNYKLKPAIDVSFTFPYTLPSSKVALVYRDNIFGTGLQELEFDKSVFEPITIK